MAGKPGRKMTMTTTTTTLLALPLLLLLAVLVKSGVTEEGIASPIASTSSPPPPPPPPPAAAAAAAKPATEEDDESIYVNASSTSKAAAGLHTPGNSDVGCRGLRSKRYVSDGFCRTLKPISEVLCTGYCVPERYMPWYPEFMKVWGKAKVMEYRCVDGVVRNQKIRLMCDNGKMRVYKVRVVKSCSCRKHVRPPSMALPQQPFNRSHQLPSSASSPASALAAAEAAETTPSKRHNRQRHHGKNRPEPRKNA